MGTAWPLVRSSWLVLLHVVGVAGDLMLCRGGPRPWDVAAAGVWVVVPRSLCHRVSLAVIGLLRPWRGLTLHTRHHGGGHCLCPTLIHHWGGIGGRHGLRSARGGSGPKDVGEGGVSLIVVRVGVASGRRTLLGRRIILVIRHNETPFAQLSRTDSSEEPVKIAMRSRVTTNWGFRPSLRPWTESRERRGIPMSPSVEGTLKAKLGRRWL